MCYVLVYEPKKSQQSVVIPSVVTNFVQQNVRENEANRVSHVHKEAFGKRELLQKKAEQNETRHERQKFETKRFGR
jgi:hypothetical protein